MIDIVDKMSNEEASFTLKHIKYNIEKAREKDDSIDVFGCDRKALDIAIQTLEQQPCEDCISRQATIDALWKALYEYEDKTEKQFIDSEELDIADWFQHRVFVQNMSDIDRQTILNMPSITPQQKATGSWVEKQVVDNEEVEIDQWQSARCSKCDKYHTTPYLHYFDDYNYCPNCGAKMLEPQESEG